MGKVFVVTSGKGGVGKTTTTANLGVALAEKGHSVALVDADLGLRNLDLFLGLENRIVYHIGDVLEKRATLEKALIRHKKYTTLSLLTALQSRSSRVQEKDMKRIVSELAMTHEYVFVDSPAGIDTGFHVATAGADDALVVTTPELPAVRDADRVVGLLRSKGIASPKLIINRLRPNMVRRGDMLSQSDVLEFLRIDLLGIVPEDEMTIVATNRGEPSVCLQGSLAGAHYRDIARRLLGEAVPLRKMASGEGVVAFLRRFVGVGR